MTERHELEEPEVPPPSVLPDSLTVQFPAHLCLLSTVRAATTAIVDQMRCDDTCGPHLQLAADELAAMVIEDAKPWSSMELVIAHDDADVYVRMSATRADPGQPLRAEKVSQMLLEAAVESYDVGTDDGSVYAVLQRPLVAD